MLITASFGSSNEALNRIAKERRSIVNSLPRSLRCPIKICFREISYRSPSPRFGISTSRLTIPANYCHRFSRVFPVFLLKHTDSEGFTGIVLDPATYLKKKEKVERYFSIWFRLLEEFYSTSFKSFLSNSFNSPLHSYGVVFRSREIFIPRILVLILLERE